MRKILDLLPVPYSQNLRIALDDRKGIAKELSIKTKDEFKMEIITVEKGSTSIEDSYDEAINAPYILEKIEEVGNNYDAIVIDCFGDPGLEAAREITDVPIIGVNEASTHLASQISRKFSIINILPESENLILSILAKNGLLANLASIVTINIPVLSLEDNLDITVNTIVKGVEKAVKEDKAQAIVFGCTGMSSVLKNTKEKLTLKGIDVPIIEPLRAGIYTAVAWLLLGVTQSKLTYMQPRDKTRIK